MVKITRRNIINGQASAAQKRWHNWLRDYGCQITQQPYPTIQHIKGARMRLKGVPGYAGEWYCYGLCHELHLGNYPTSLAVSKRRFINKYGTEKDIWIRAVARYEEQYDRKPMSEEAYQIILERA